MPVLHNSSQFSNIRPDGGKRQTALGGEPPLSLRLLRSGCSEAALPPECAREFKSGKTERSFSLSGTSSAACARTRSSWPQQRPSRKRIGRNLAFIHHHGPSHQQIAHAHTRLHRLLEGRPIADDIRVEYNDLSVGPLLQPAPLSRLGRGPLQHRPL